MDEMTFGKWALIVGASRGLGVALVEEFLNRSWGVVATGRTNSLVPRHRGFDCLKVARL